jgi:HlyD family secretion protein
MKRKTWLYLAVSASTLAAGLFWAFSPRPIEVEAAPVTQGRFEVTVDEDGRTRLLARYAVSAPLAGRLSRITLREGDAVTEGATLALLTPTMPVLQDERTLRELKARVESAQDNVIRASSRVERAGVALEMAKNEARRSAQLAQDGFIAQTKSESDRLSALATQRELESAAAERRIAAHDLEQAQAAISRVRQTGTGAAAQSGFSVRSPIGGQVLRVSQSSEGVVALGTPLLEVGDTSRLEIVADLLTTDALAARPGSRVYIERWGGPVTLEGRLSRVEPAAFTKVSALGVEEQRVRVVIDVSSPRELWKSLGDGFRVSVRIVTLSQDNALRVPLGAVFPLSADAPAESESASPKSQSYGVFLLDGNRARKVAVDLGARNGTFASIKSGLAVGQSVVIYPPAGLADGKLLKVRTP